MLEIRKVKYKNNTMDDYLVDESILGGIVDALITQKQPPINNEEKASFRQESVQKLNQKIDDAFFAQLNDDQIDELDKLLQQDDISQERLEEFFKDNGVDLNHTMEQAVKEFSQEF